MINIERKRYIIVRRADSFIFCGLAKSYMFKSAEDIGDTAIKTYRSEKTAKSSFERGWRNEWVDEDYICLPVYETVRECGLTTK